MGTSTIRQMQIKREQVSQSNKVESGSKSLSKSKKHTLNDKGSISQWRYNSYEYVAKNPHQYSKTKMVRVTRTVEMEDYRSWELTWKRSKAYRQSKYHE